MDLNLALTYQQQNDNKAIVLTDTTDNWNSTTTNLTSGINMVDGDFYEIVTQATLDFSAVGAPNNDVGTRFVGSGTIALGAFGPFATQADMVYTITAALLGDAAGSVLVDGLYALTYTVTYKGDGTTVKTATLNVTILVYGVVKVATYEKLREIPVLYMCTNGCPSPEINEADLCGAYLSGIENSAFTAKTEELLNMLVVLTIIINNGSKITW